MEIDATGARSLHMFRQTFLLGSCLLILFSFNEYLLGINCPQLLREDGEQNRLLEVTPKGLHSLKPSPEGNQEPEGPGSEAVGSASTPQAAGPQTLVHNRCARLFHLITLDERI